MSEETKVACPRCGSTCITEISNARHCQQCGADFDLDRHPIATAAAKRKAEGPRGYQRPDVSQK